MNTKYHLYLMAATLPLFFSGCATDAHYVQTGDKEQIISAGQINIQDYANAANQAVKELLDSGALDKVANPPAVLFVSRIVNTTGLQIDEELPLLTTKITAALLQSRKAVITSTDTTAGGLAAKNAFLNGTTAHDPDFTLSGNIIEHIDRSGNARRITYNFQLALNDTKTGYQVWQVETDIAKQVKRPAFGL